MREQEPKFSVKKKALSGLALLTPAALVILNELLGRPAGAGPECWSIAIVPGIAGAAVLASLIPSKRR